MNVHDNVGSIMVKIPFIDKSSSAIILSYRRLINLSKILSFLGLALTLYLIYINFNPINNNLESIENNTENSAFAPNDKTNYEIKILNSTFKGLNKDLNPYQVNAVQAFRTLDNKYALEEINAKYKINGNNLLVINAKNGILNENSHMLELTEDVQFFLGEGILKAQKAQLNLLNKEAFGKMGVILFYKNCEITSNKFSSTNDNNIINFKGSVSTIIDVSDF
ncbi:MULTISPECIES: LPS export ABC transporter periplasmic protein LptC [unclassified Candidatus Tisiphia]|uniref:LPS export ABC transporter periplasmic protein LptC n=1 Tax=unclassified Candidatus Tisiphia TaxID=2996318 RepID=UPI003CCB1823